MMIFGTGVRTLHTYNVGHILNVPVIGELFIKFINNYDF